MPAHFNQYGISFQYPDNWTLEEEEFEDLPEEQHSVTVYSPDGAFWSVAVHPQPSDPQKLAAAALEAFKLEYEQVEVDVVEETCQDHSLVGYDLHFFYLDLTSTAQIRSFRSSKATYSLICQAEDREYESLQHVFQAMNTSLLREIE